MNNLLSYRYFSVGMLYSVLIGCCLIWGGKGIAHAQESGLVGRPVTETGMVGGVVLETGTSNRVAQVNVRNMRNRTTVTTDLKGEFSIRAQVGDTLMFSKIGYESHTTVLNTLSDILIDLKPGTIRIDAVNIEGKTREQELRESMDSYRRQGVYSEGKPSVLSYVFNPLTALYERFSRSGRQARRFRNYMENEMEALQVDRIFSKYRIVELTGLAGEDLNNFAQLYRPTFDRAQQWNEYDVTHYILTSFRQFEADGRPAMPKLPKLEIPPQKK